MPPNLFMYVTAVVLSICNESEQFIDSEVKHIKLSKAAISSNSFMCLLDSESDHVPFVLIPLHTAPQPEREASEGFKNRNHKICIL